MYNNRRLCTNMYTIYVLSYIHVCISYRQYSDHTLMYVFMYIDVRYRTSMVVIVHDTFSDVVYGIVVVAFGQHIGQRGQARTVVHVRVISHG